MRALIIPTIVVTGVLGLQAQVTSIPKRIATSFKGDFPWLWIVEGNGTLREVRMRMLDETGKECRAWEGLSAQPVQAGIWTAWSMISTQAFFQGLTPGRYTLDFKLLWERQGKPYLERTENLFVLEEQGGTWLSKAYPSDSNRVGLSLDRFWTPGGPLSLSLSTTKGIKNLKVQIVSDLDETVLLPWSSLPLEKGNKTWTLPGRREWPKSPLWLWAVWEDERAGIQVLAREIPCEPSLGGRPNHQMALVPTAPQTAQALAVQSVTEATSDNPVFPQEDWLKTWQKDEPSIPWEDTNRIITVTTGYGDTERTATELWPSPNSEPQFGSVGITGASRLGKALYSINYLLPWTGGALISAESVAEQAANVSSDSPSLPLGAATLKVGGVKAPVVVSAGTVDDSLGRPLAAGYPWAFFKATLGSDGKPVRVTGVQSANEWTTKNPNAPPIGLTSIINGALFRDFIVRESACDVGSDTSLVSFSGNRLHHTLQFLAQDPGGRTLAAKAIGSVTMADSGWEPKDLVSVTPKSSPDQMFNFDSNTGELPVFMKLNGSSGVVFVESNGSVRLDPAQEYSERIPDYYCDLVSQPGGCYSQGVSEAGKLTLELGVFHVGSSMTVDFKSSGPLKCTLVAQGETIKNIEVGVFNGIAAPTFKVENFITQSGLTPPVRMRLECENNSPIILEGSSPLEAQFLKIDDLRQSNISEGPRPLNLNEAKFMTGRMPGYSHTQQGFVWLAGYGVCTVALVIDADGASVAEIKDPEGKTVLKIVNPDANLVGDWTDHLGKPLYASDKVRKNDLSVIGVEQKNLVTQYIFDSEGHLRLVIPPMGSSQGGGLGWAPNSSSVVTALQWDGTSAPSSSIPYATYNHYDQSGHLDATYNPDEGLTRFIVDQKGRVHYSQTESQRVVRNTWTRTIYDQIFRVVAVGELKANEATINPEDVVPVSSDADLATAIAQLVPGFLSSNFYDAYLETPFQVDANQQRTVGTPGISMEVAKVLPGPELWSAFPDGHLTQTQDDKSIERYYYDQDGRIVIRWVTFNPNESSNRRDYAIGIFYDFAGRVKRLVYPAGPTGEPLQVVYTYDDLGRLYAVGTPNDVSYFARYAYQPTGEVAAIVYGPGEGFAAKRMLLDPQGWLRTLTVQGR